MTETEQARARFSEMLADPARCAAADYAEPSDVLLVLFGGIAGGVSMPVYEFFRVTEGYPAKRLFLRDPWRAWYLRGLPGIAEDDAGLLNALRATVTATGVKRLVMCGASAGGFAAISLGARLGAERIIAFSPQTTIGAANRARFRDERWLEQIADLHARMGDENPLYELPVVLGETGGAPRVDVHVCSADPLDLAHAAMIETAPGVRVIDHPRGGHKLVKHLRDTGELRDILLDALQPV